MGIEYVNSDGAWVRCEGRILKKIMCERVIAIMVTNITLARIYNTYSTRLKVKLRW